MDPEVIVEIGQTLRAWRQSHPQATFDEIETEVQRHLAVVHAQVVAELIQPSPPSGEAHAPQPVEAAGQEGRPVCPQCARPMQASGQRRRRVATRQGPAITLQRAYYVCPACGAGRFPPRRGARAEWEPL
jgi:hypothetical protein